MKIIPRDYQDMDAQAMIAAFEVYQRVMGRWATGLGKSVLFAMLAKHFSRFGRVMILVDVVKLAEDLAKTIYEFTGVMPGIECGEQRASNGQFLTQGDQVVVGTFQTMISEAGGAPRFADFDPKDFVFLGIDECESVFPPDSEYRRAVDHFASNPKCMVGGASATPYRTDNVAAANLFQHVAFDRDLRWGVDNGWLVEPRQGFVHVALDFSSLKIRKQTGDYKDEDIARALKEERVRIELARGILDACGDRKTIIVCPDIDTAEAITQFLNGEKPGCSRCIFGEVGDREIKKQIFKEHKLGAFQFLTSVMMLTKGYDDPSIINVVNCRKTRSRRLYEQIAGRGARPINPLELIDCKDAAERIAKIAASAKPNFFMLNMVGIKKSVRDMTVLDLLGKVTGDGAVDRMAKELMEEKGLGCEEAIEEAQRIVEVEREDAQDEDELAADVEDAASGGTGVLSVIDIKGETSITYTDMSAGGGVRHDGGDQGVQPKHRRILENEFKYPPKRIDSMDGAEASRLVQKSYARRTRGYVTSYAQIRVLKDMGWMNADIRKMDINRASNIITNRERKGA